MHKVPKRFRPQGFLLYVRRSRTGRGVFAGAPIPKGACIIEYKGKPVSKKDMEENAGKYYFWTSRSSMIDGNIKGNVARFINHSCAPNCEADLYKRRIFIIALKNIQTGEELTYDYGDEYFDMHFTPRGCRCVKCSTKKKRV